MRKEYPDTQREWNKSRFLFSFFYPFPFFALSCPSLQKEGNSKKKAAVAAIVGAQGQLNTEGKSEALFSLQNGKNTTFFNLSLSFHHVVPDISTIVRKEQHNGIMTASFLARGPKWKP